MPRLWLSRKRRLSCQKQHRVRPRTTELTGIYQLLPGIAAGCDKRPAGVRRQDYLIIVPVRSQRVFWKKSNGNVPGALSSDDQKTTAPRPTTNFASKGPQTRLSSLLSRLSPIIK